MILCALVLAGTLAGLARFVPGFCAAGFFGFMLAFAGASGWRGRGVTLRHMLWNRVGLRLPTKKPPPSPAGANSSC